MNIIELVQSLESDYGMDVSKWPVSDDRLEKLNRWYIEHPDEGGHLSDKTIKEIQKMLDSKAPKVDIYKIFGITKSSLEYNIRKGRLSDKKWRAWKWIM